MQRIIFFLTMLAFYSCSNHAITYYVVRHAEKESGTTMMATTIKTSDVPLSEKGWERAEHLKELLKDKDIKYIFSTNTIRTKATAQPLSDAIGVTTKIYDAGDKNFVAGMKKLNENVLIVGHANTVDDVVNELTGKTLLHDLPDSAYGDLFIVKLRKDGVDYKVSKY